MKLGLNNITVSSTGTLSTGVPGTWYWNQVDSCSDLRYKTQPARCHQLPVRQSGRLTGSRSGYNFFDSMFT